MRIKMIGRSIPIILALSIILAFSAFAAGEPVILSQPQSYTFPAGTALPAEAYFSVLAQGDGELSYQWQSSTNGGEWVNVTAASGTTPNLTAQVSQFGINGQRLWRCVVSNSAGSTVSTAATVSVAAYIADTLPQLLGYVTETGTAIFDWVGQACVAITGTPLLLFTVGFLALGGAIAIVSRLLARS